jgi:hypothetical protein
MAKHTLSDGSCTILSLFEANASWPLRLGQAAGASGGSLFGKMKLDQLTHAITAVSVTTLITVETRIVPETRCGAIP